MTKNILTYKGYLGSVEFSTEDNCFFGKIQGIDGLVSFEGTSVKELTKAFHEAVDEYVALCEKVGKKPLKSYAGTFNVRVSPDIHQKAARLAVIEGKSLNGFVEEAISEKIKTDREIISIDFETKVKQMQVVVKMPRKTCPAKKSVSRIAQVKKKPAVAKKKKR